LGSRLRHGLFHPRRLVCDSLRFGNGRNRLLDYLARRKLDLWGLRIRRRLGFRSRSLISPALRNFRLKHGRIFRRCLLGPAGLCGRFFFHEIFGRYGLRGWFFDHGPIGSLRLHRIGLRLRRDRRRLLHGRLLGSRGFRLPISG
jgi:hypothetical protein